MMPRLPLRSSPRRPDHRVRIFRRRHIRSCPRRYIRNRHSRVGQHLRTGRKRDRYTSGGDRPARTPLLKDNKSRRSTHSGRTGRQSTREARCSLDWHNKTLSRLHRACICSFCKRGRHSRTRTDVRSWGNSTRPSHRNHTGRSCRSTRRETTLRRPRRRGRRNSIACKCNRSNLQPLKHRFPSYRRSYSGSTTCRIVHSDDRRNDRGKTRHPLSMYR